MAEDDQLVSGNSVFWGLMAVATFATTQASCTVDHVLGDVEMSIMPLRISPIVCLADAAHELLSLLRVFLSQTRKLIGLPITLDEPTTNEAMRHAAPLKVALFLFGALPQAVKIFAFEGLIGTKVITGIYLGAITIHAVSYSVRRPMRISTSKTNLTWCFYFLHMALMGFIWPRVVEFGLVDLCKKSDKLVDVLVVVRRVLTYAAPATILALPLYSLTSFRPPRWLICVMQYVLGLSMALNSSNEYFLWGERAHAKDHATFWRSTLSTFKLQIGAWVETYATMMPAVLLSLGLAAGLQRWLSPAASEARAPEVLERQDYFSACVDSALWTMKRLWWPPYSLQVLQKWLQRQSPQVLGLAFLLLHVMTAVAYYAVLYDSTGTWSPQWASMLG